MNSSHVLRSLVCGALLAVASAPSVTAEGTFDIPPGAHFNPQKLERVGDFLRDQIANGKIPGAILLIQQHGKPVYHEFFGVQDVVSKAPMVDQTIFRLFSMTKAITSVVAMTLVDEGKLKLEDPVKKYIPSFANVKVGVEKKSEDGTKTLELVPPNRPPTILDLMRHTSGITYGFYGDSWSAKPMRPQISMRAISTLPNSPSGSQSCRCTTSRGRSGNTAIPPTCWRGSWKSYLENPCSRSRGKSCSIRSA